MYEFLKWIMRTAVHVVLLGKWRLTGTVNVPASGPLLVCSNHIGTLDPPLVPAFLPRRDTWSVAKKEYWRNPMAGWIFDRYHAFPVVRHSADRAAVKRMTKILRDGHVLVLYPEGTRITSGGLHRPEPGAGFLATLTGAAVLPVAVTGTRDVLPKGSLIPRRRLMEMRVGKPFRIRSRNPDGSRVDHQDAADAIMLSIAELLPAGDLRGEFADVDAWKDRVGALRDYSGT
jgi:1-acyl-sn-glycerol-3-phosphate acyltransferase